MTRAYAKNWKGTVVGHLTVRARTGAYWSGLSCRPVWDCECSCGTIVERTSDELRRAVRRNLLSSCAACRPKLMKGAVRKANALAAWITRRAKSVAS